jgi:hypothetical protein
MIAAGLPRQELACGKADVVGDAAPRSAVDPLQDRTQHQDCFKDGARGQPLFIQGSRGTLLLELVDGDLRNFRCRRVTHYLLGDPAEYAHYAADVSP